MQRHHWYAIFSFLLATGIVVAAILGPLVTGVIRFHLPDSLVNQYVGGEIVTLFLAAPVLVVSGLLWLRNDPLAPALAFGPAAYTVYTFVTAILGQEVARNEGNSERAFPLYVALIAGGVALAVISAVELLSREAAVPSDRLRMVAAWVFLIIAGFFALAWIGQIGQVYRGNEPADYHDGPTLFWLIRMLDLGFLLPGLATLGIGLLRHHPAAIRLCYGVAGYAVCMAGAVLGMAVAMWLKDDPAASVPMMLFLIPVTFGLAVLAWRLLWLYRHPRGHEQHVPAQATSTGTAHAG